MVAHRNKFIDDVDLSEITSLTHLLDKHEADGLGDEVRIIKHSPYYGEKHVFYAFKQATRIVYFRFKHLQYFYKI